MKAFATEDADDDELPAIEHLEVKTWLPVALEQSEDPPHMTNMPPYLFSTNTEDADGFEIWYHTDEVGPCCRCGDAAYGRVYYPDMGRDYCEEHYSDENYGQRRERR